MSQMHMALDAYLNSAIREGVLPRPQPTAKELCVKPDRGPELRIPLRAAASGRVLSRPGLQERSATGWVPTSVERVLGELASSGGGPFRQRVLDSLSAISAAPSVEGEPEDWSFIEAEQALSAGHPFHPTPRSRDGMGDEDIRIYAPEWRGRFALQWVDADPDALGLSDGARALFCKLAEADIPDAKVRGVPLPWHPWQAAQIAGDPDIMALRQAGQWRPLGAGQPGWASTSSMRTVYAAHAPYMVKTSLRLKLTNSIRTLSLREVVRGIHVTDLMASDLGRMIRDTFPTLRILAEPGYAALRGPSGDLIEDSIAVLRDNPFQSAEPTGPVMLASLCEVPPTGRSPLGRMVARAGQAEAWFRRFLQVAIHPLLELRARHGLLFGAHQQNMMLDLRDGWPEAVWVRDCQGTGHLSAFHDHLTAACPAIGQGAENVVDAELGDGLVTYYVVVNGVLNTLWTLVLDGLAEEQALLRVWHDFLRQSRSTCPGDTTLYDRLLNRPTLTCKGNFATTLSGVNEADGDARGQLAAFLEIPNPIAETVGA